MYSASITVPAASAASTATLGRDCRLRTSASVRLGRRGRTQLRGRLVPADRERLPAAQRGPGAGRVHRYAEVRTPDVDHAAHLACSCVVEGRNRRAELRRMRNDGDQHVVAIDVQRVLRAAIGLGARVQLRHLPADVDESIRRLEYRLRRRHELRGQRDEVAEGPAAATVDVVHDPPPDRDFVGGTSQACAAAVTISARAATPAGSLADAIGVEPPVPCTPSDSHSRASAGAWAARTATSRRRVHRRPASPSR